MTKIYCVKHEEMTYTENNDLSHSQMFFIESVPEYENCDFPLGYAFSAPPTSAFEEFDDKTLREWSEFCKETEPSPEEIEVSDLQAQEFINDCEGL